MMSNKITQTSEDLIYLVSCAVNETVPDRDRCKKMDLEKVYKLSKRHSLAAAAAHALEKSVKLPVEFEQAKKKAIRKIALFNIERAKILQCFEENGIWYLPLKGIILKDMYPKSTMREMTDNDILFDRKKMDAVRIIMEQLGYSCERYDKGDQDVYKKPPTLVFELHRYLYDDKLSPLEYNYYKNIKNRLIKDEGNNYGYSFRDEDFYVYLISHMHKHYTVSGIGLRSLLDIYIFNKHKYLALDHSYVETQLNELKISEFERNMRSLSEKVFCQKSLCDNEIKELLYLIDSGAYGTYEINISRKLKNNDSMQAKGAYILKRIFVLSDKDLKTTHPVVYKHKALYPLLIIYRPFKALTINRKKVIKEIKMLKAFTKKQNTGGNYE